MKTYCSRYIYGCLLLFFTLIISYNCSDSSGIKPFHIALIGNVPPIGDPAVEPDLALFYYLKDDIEETDIRFSVHTGGFIAENTLCSDEHFERWHKIINSFKAPFFYVVGSNEWLHSYSEHAGKYDPEERLERLREVFFSKPESFGTKKLKVETLSGKYPENYRWVYNNVMFIALNVQGNNNNLGRTPEADKEYYERNTIVNSYMSESFYSAKEKENAGIMIFIQADPWLEANKGLKGCLEFQSALEQEVLGFNGKPVVLVHGGSNYFKIDKPLINPVSRRRIENFTRVSTFGAPDLHWIQVTFDPDDPGLFSFRQRIVKKNIINYTGN